MSNDIVIAATNLSKTYKLYDTPLDRMKEALHWRGKRYHKDFYALHDVSFTIRKGEVIGIIGKNGAGKSTLLKIITGVLTPTNGQIVINGRVSALLELGAGFNPEYTGLENIHFQGNLLGYTENEILAKIPVILEFADIGEFIHQPVKMYSSGMFARLAFAVAINIEPEILIVDEALSVGDFMFQQKCLLHMKQMLQSHVTVIFVSHNLSQIRGLCSQALYFKAGQLIMYDRADLVCDTYLNDSTKINNLVQNSVLDAKVEVFPHDLHPLFHMDSSFDAKIYTRSGSGELRFVGFDIYDMQDEKVSDITYQQKIKLVISFVTHKLISAGVAVGIMVSDSHGNPLLALNSNFYDFYLPELPSGYCGVLVCEFIFPFFNVDCVFSVGAKPDPFADYFYDRVFNCSCVHVMHSKLLLDKQVTGGIMYIEDLSFELFTGK